MLMLYNQFVLNYAIRSPLYLMNPTVTNTEEVRLPRYSVVHDLSIGEERHFPNREHYYYKEIVKNKKIPITHIMDLDVKEDVTTLLNKYATSEARKWRREHILTFIEKDLLATPNKDVNTVSVFNYNLIKDMYKIKTSLTANYNRHKNISITYWNNVANAVKSDPTSYHIVKVDLPTLIPNYQMLTRILTFPPIKIGRIVDDRRLLEVMEIYQWLTDETRGNSSLKDIDDTNSSSIILELNYKGYSAFLPLNIIRGVAEESKLESALKVNSVRQQKLFLLVIRRIQDRVTAILNGEVDSLSEVDEEDIKDLENRNDHDTESDPQFDDFHDEDVEDTEEEPVTPEAKPDELVVSVSVDGKKPKLTKVELKELKKSEVQRIDKVIADSVFGDDDMELLDIIDKGEEDQFLDDLYESKIQNVNETTPIEIGPEEVDPLPMMTDEKLHLLTFDQKPEDITEAYILKAITNKTHSASEIRAMRRLKEERTKLKDPYTKEPIDIVVKSSGKKLKLTKENIKLNSDSKLIAESMKTDIIGNFDKTYINEVMKDDIIKSVANLEKANIIIKNYEIEENISSVDKFETHKITLKPLDGKESTIYFRIPKIEEDGTFEVSGTKYRMRKVRSDLPVRKISPIKVAVTSNYGKFFVARTERKSNDREAYIIKYIQDDYLGDNEIIKKVVPRNKIINYTTKPNIYTTLSSKFSIIKTKDLELVLDDELMSNYIKPNVIKEIQDNKLHFVGVKLPTDIIVVDDKEVFHNYSKKQELGTIEDLLGMDPDKVPRPFSVMKVLGSDIPLGVCLSYYLGIGGLIKLTGTEFKVIGPRQQHKPTKDELVLRFEDHKLILTTDTEDRKLLFNGFLFYKETTKLYPLSSFDNKDIYLTLLEARGKGLIYLKELGTLKELFLDPITNEVLGDMGYPTDFIPLLISVNHLLTDFNYKEINDPTEARIRGYDRVPGLMYRALAESVREHRIKGKASSKIAVDPYKVWNYVTQDNTVKSRDEVNPLLQLKENEAVTLTGMDGLSTGAVPKELRRFHKNDTGLISEATVDSKDTAINTYLTPYAKVKDLRGTVDMDNKDYEKDPAMAFSSSIQVSPMAEYDD